MALTDLISVTITGHGKFTVTVNDFDHMIAYHLPASPYDLRRKINERSDFGEDVLAARRQYGWLE